VILVTRQAESERPTVVVCDDHTLVRQSLVSMLSDDVDVVGEAASGKQALLMVERLQPSIVMLDVTMPAPDGLEVAVEIRRRWPDVRILMVTMHTDDETLHRATDVGVDGYVTKAITAEELRQAVAAIADGGAWVSSEVAHRLMRQARDQHDALTQREREVLYELAAGYRISEIAERLYLSEKTVKNHLSSVYAKLGAETGAQAVAIAYRSGMVSPGRVEEL